MGFRVLNIIIFKPLEDCKIIMNQEAEEQFSAMVYIGYM